MGCPVVPNSAANAFRFNHLRRYFVSSTEISAAPCINLKTLKNSPFETVHRFDYEVKLNQQLMRGLADHPTVA